MIDCFDVLHWRGHKKLPKRMNKVSVIIIMIMMNEMSGWVEINYNI